VFLFFLLSDFDDDDVSTLEGQPSGLAATEVLSQTPAAANLLSGMSSNPLDDLVSIFGTNGTTGAGGGFGAAPTLSAGTTNNDRMAGVVDPLAELGGLSISGGGGGSLTPVAVGQTQLQSQAKTVTPVQQQQEEDLLGLF
jgi:hypothetical protein